MAKYEPKTKPTELGVEEFIAAVPDPRRREEAVQVDGMMRRVSGHNPKMWGPSIIGYGDIITAMTAAMKAMPRGSVSRRAKPSSSFT